MLLKGQVFSNTLETEYYSTIKIKLIYLSNDYFISSKEELKHIILQIADSLIGKIETSKLIGLRIEKIDDVFTITIEKIYEKIFRMILFFISSGLKIKIIE